MHIRLRILAFAAGLALATTAHADTSPVDPESFHGPQRTETSPLDPENFLGPELEETFALIAADLARCGTAPASAGEIGVTAELVPHAASPAQIDLADPVTAALEAQEPARDLAASAAEIALPAEETTGSVTPDVGVPTASTIPGDGSGTPVETSPRETAHELVPEETTQVQGSADEFTISLLP